MDFPRWKSRGVVQRDSSNGCLLWQGPKTKAGYGYCILGTRRVAAHRLAYEIAHGPLPEGKVVCHKCDVPLCVEPSHLFAGSNADNMQDMVRKGRGRWGPNRRRKYTPVPFDAEAASRVPTADALSIEVVPTLDEQVRRFVVLGVSVPSIAKQLGVKVKDVDEVVHRISTDSSTPKVLVSRTK